MLIKNIPGNLRKGLPFLIIFAVVFLTFANTLSFHLLAAWDDGEFVIGMSKYFRPSISNLVYLLFDTGSDNYVPLVNLSYALDYNFKELTGFSTYHFQNVLWHAIAVCGLFKCMRILGIPGRFALLAALIYAVNPQRSESVAWVAERRDVMCGTFYFWSLYFYFKDGGKKFLPLLPLVFFICALLSKPAAISMPCVLAMYEIWKGRSFFPLRKYLRLLPYVILAVMIAWGTARLQLYVGSGYDITERFFIVLYNIAWYSVKNFYPGEMSPIYPQIVFDANTIMYMAVFYILTALVLLRVFFRNRDLFFYTLLPLAVSYVVALAPTIGIVQVGTGTWDYADRYSYIPAGIVFIAFAALPTLFPQQKIAGLLSVEKLFSVMLAGFMIFLAVTTYFYNYAWKSYRNLIAVVAQHDPPNKYYLYFYGIIVCDEMKLDESERSADYILASSRKDQLDRNGISLYYMALYLKGRIAVKRGDHRQASVFFKDAIPHLREFLFQRRDSYIEALKAAFKSFVLTGLDYEALYCCDLIALNAPAGTLEFHFYRGLSFCMRNKLDLALVEFHKAQVLVPDDINIKANIERLEKAVAPVQK